MLGLVGLLESLHECPSEGRVVSAVLKVVDPMKDFWLAIFVVKVAV